MALSLFCGGLGVAEATVHVNEGTGVTSEVYTTGETYSRELVDEKLNSKANANDVATNTANIANLENNKLSKADASITYATKADVNTELTKKADKTYVDNALNDKADKADVYSKTDAENTFATKTELTAKADATALAGKANTDLSNLTEAGKTAIKTTMTDELAKKADNDTVTVLDGRVGVVEGKVAALETTVSDPSNGLVKKVTDLKTKTTQISFDPAKGTIVNGVDFMAQEVDAHGKGLTGVSTLHTTGAATIGGALTAAGLDAGTGAITGGSLSVTGEVKGNRVDAGSGEIKTTGVVNAGTLNTTGNATVGGELNATGKVSGNGLDARTGDIKGGSLSVTGAVNGSSVNADTLNTTGDATVGGDLSAKNTEINGTLHATGATTLDGALTAKGEAAFEKNVTMDQKLTVTGDTSLNKTDVNGALTAKGDVILGTNTAQTVTVNGIADFNAAVKMNNGLNVTNGETNLKNTTVDGDLKVTGTITTNKMVFGDKPTNYTEIDHGKVTSKNLEVNGAGQAISSSSIFNAEENKVGFANNATGDQSFHKQTSDIIMDNVKDRDNSNYRTQTKTETKDIITDKDGNSSTTSQTASENKTYLKDKDGKNTNSTIDTAKGYDKTIKGENGETSTKQDELNITNTAQKGTIKNDAMNIENNASGNITNKANTMDTNVTGKATESYGSLDTTVNGNETHIVKGTKTETVDGKVTENYGNGQETNVTGDQDIKVSGTQTTTATDINRNASSGMVDKVDNAYGTNTETKEAGKTTTDVSIKGTGEKGQYIRGANESRDYLINGTLKNSETKTVEKTSTEITDGNGKTSATIQDVNNLAGSVTNGTETGVSGIHANDNSVSIDSIVTDGNKYSVINQKKGSIQSTVVDGTNSTVILQDKDNVTIASSNGTVGIVGKDIVNNAQNTITNTAGTSITNQVNDSKVTTDANGTTFENNTPAVSDGGATTTKINGNQITTGRVDANELGVSDKDGANTADFSVEAGEGKGVKASAGNGTTTGSLDVKADEVSSSVKDASGKGSTFKQRIDKIMMESKDVSIKAEETLTNEAKVITNKASEVINNEAVNINNTATGIITSKASEIKNQADKLISNKVGENTWENMENGKITTSIKDGAKQNLTQSNAAGTTQSTVDVGKSTVTIQNADGLVDVVTDGTNTSVQNQTASQIAADVKDGAGNENASVANATISANTIKSGSKANTVISTADGTSFSNSEAAAPVTGDSGAGTAVNTTIKGNTITTGKVTMDYAEVMKDLGVHGNAKVDQNLEVGGTSTLKGDVTMESNATVKKDLKVEGITDTKTLNVTEDANVGRDLAVGGNATIAGDVTARSYKVDGKTYIDANGIHANGQKITDVADGSISEGSKDAVNGGQLYGVKRDLEHQVDKVGANAAAMANLRPMEFDLSSKWNIAAAIGNYGSETAAALGAFYRPNDDVMVNLSTAFGTGENMVGGGVSVRLGKSGNKLSREENNALKAQVDDLTARMDALLSVLNPNMSKDFPDVPENHWAYEAVSRLAGNDIVQGYPDGEFHGERTMTRYEMAEIIYNALSRGAEAERELVEEFKPELQAMAASEKATAEKAEG